MHGPMNVKIGLSVLKSSCQTGSSSSPIWFHMFFLIAFLDEAFIRNIIRQFLITISSKNNNNNNNQYLIIIVDDSDTLFCCSKFQWAREKFSWECTGNLGTPRKKRFASPALDCIPTSATHAHTLTRDKNNICRQTAQ
jgi:hypothetical protein